MYLLKIYTKFLILAKCGPNEVLDGCGPREQETCNQRLVNKTRASPCIAGCFCKSGFIRDSDNICIPIDWCPSQNE